MKLISAPCGRGSGHLNSYFILALNTERSSVIEPDPRLRGSRLFTDIRCRSPGYDWVTEQRSTPVVRGHATSLRWPSSHRHWKVKAQRRRPSPPISCVPAEQTLWSTIDAGTRFG